MQSLYRYAFGLVVCAASCGQILDVDAEYELDPNAGGTAGNENCGDGTTTGTEVCDDGNKVDGDGCDSNCTQSGCGNGVKAGEEECDDGNASSSDECTEFCRIAICGDGFLRPGEQCDDGNALDGDDCDSNCTISACGNGIKTNQEECDDGNTMNGDGCSSACISENACGDTVVEGKEVCDDGNMADGDGCDSNCTLTGCGNGIVTAGEQCDDGNVSSGDSCDSSCQATVCGDGMITAGEQCDDGNEINNDACSNSCRKTPNSCLNLPETCGPQQNEDCCSPNYVQGGQFNRINDVSYPANVSSFRMDRFEVTVGRFRKFVDVYFNNKPASNDGEHPLIAGTGWNVVWNGSLPIDNAALRTGLASCGSFSSWTDTPGGNESIPINCVTWYEAFAFCAWDSGRLPTEAEWNYAAAAGNQQRFYPWSNPANSMTISPMIANYDCTGDGSIAQDCKSTDQLRVGARSPAGDGLWGQADLGGGMYEWNFDFFAVLVNPCDNCANSNVMGANRVVRGGGWGSAATELANSYRDAGVANARNATIGLRCARNL